MTAVTSFRHLSHGTAAGDGWLNVYNTKTAEAHNPANNSFTASAGRALEKVVDLSHTVADELDTHTDQAFDGGFSDMMGKAGESICGGFLKGLLRVISSLAAAIINLISALLNTARSFFAGDKAEGKRLRSYAMAELKMVGADLISAGRGLFQLTPVFGHAALRALDILYSKAAGCVSKNYEEKAANFSQAGQYLSRVPEAGGY